MTTKKKSFLSPCNQPSVGAACYEVEQPISEKPQQATGIKKHSVVGGNGSYQGLRGACYRRQTCGTRAHVCRGVE